jgi:hypothetical protein
MAMRQIGLGSLEEQYKFFDALQQEGLESVKYLKSIANKPSYDKQPKTYGYVKAESF